MRNYNTITAPYPVFDSQGRDIAPLVLDKLFSSTFRQSRDHLIAMAHTAIEAADLRIKTPPSFPAPWSEMIVYAGDTREVDKHIRQWYRECREDIDKVAPFVCLDFLHFFTCVTLHHDGVIEGEGKIALYAARAILGQLPTPDGLEVVSKARLWFASRLRRRVLDELKRDRSRLGVMNL